MTGQHRDEASRHVTPEFDAEADAIGSYYAAIAEIGRRVLRTHASKARVKAGEEPVPSTGYFGRRP